MVAAWYESANAGVSVKVLAATELKKESFLTIFAASAFRGF